MTSPKSVRFGKVRACWAILRGGSVMQNIDVHGQVYTTGKHGKSQFNGVLVRGRPMRLSDMTTFPRQVSV